MLTESKELKGKLKIVAENGKKILSDLIINQIKF